LVNGEIDMEKISLRNYIHRLLSPNNIKPNWNAALYMYLALIVLFVISQLFKLGNVSTAFVVGGILTSQVVVLNLPVKLIIRLNIIISIIFAIAFLTAAIGLIALWIALIFLLIWGFLSSSLNILGKMPGQIVYIGMVTYLIAILSIVNTQSTAFQWGLWAFLGAIIASFILIIPKIWHKDKSTRELVANCFMPNADTNTLIGAKALLGKSHPTPKINSMVELSLGLLRARQLANAIDPNLKGEAKQILREFNENINQLSGEVANDILTDNNNPNLDITILNKKIDEMTSVTELDDDTRSIVLKNMKKSRKIFENSKKILKGDLVLDIPSIIISEEISPMKKLRANFNLNNMYIRHGIRLCVAVGAGFIITVLTASHNFYWIAFSILAVLQPDITSTFDRMVIRTVATTVGVIVAIIISGILVSLGLHVIIYAFILVLLAVIVAYMRVSYLYYVVAVAMLILFLQPSTDIVATGLARFTDILIGSVIAYLVGYVILPSKLKVNLKQQVVKRINSNIDYIRFATKPAPDNRKNASIALLEMILSHNNLEAGIEKVTDSFDDAGDDIQVLNSIAEAIDRLSRDLSNSAERVTTTTESHPIWESVAGKMEEVLIDLKNSLETDTDPQPLPDSGLISARIEEIKIKSGDKDAKIVFEYIKWIISDIYSLYYSIKDAKDNEIFKKYKNI
jgi:uncharacterized membrane protein YgaE (UPF0421/DUF939 family)